MSALDILAAAGLVNYYGKAAPGGTEGAGKLSVEPVLIEKGSTRLALYGLGYIRDARLYKILTTPGELEWRARAAPAALARTSATPPARASCLCLCGHVRAGSGRRTRRRCRRATGGTCSSSTRTAPRTAAPPRAPCRPVRVPPRSAPLCGAPLAAPPLAPCRHRTL